MGDEREHAAARVIAAHIGAQVVLHDDGSAPSMYDLEIRYTDGRRGAVEVTAAEDEQLRADYGAIQGPRSVIEDERLTGGWLVLLRSGARVKAARAALPDLLVRFEAAGLDDVSLYRQRKEADTWAHDALDSLGVTDTRAGSVRPGMVALLPALRVAWLSSDPEDVVAFAERFAASRPDNLHKLGDSGAAERHLFMWGGDVPQDWPSMRPLGLDIEALPSRAPQLPPEITDVWVAAQGERPSRIVHWNAREGWHEAGRIT